MIMSFELARAPANETVNLRLTILGLSWLPSGYDLEPPLQVMGLIPGQVTKIQHVIQCGQKKKWQYWFREAYNTENQMKFT